MTSRSFEAPAFRRQALWPATCNDDADEGPWLDAAAGAKAWALSVGKTYRLPRQRLHGGPEAAFPGQVARVTYIEREPGKLECAPGQIIYRGAKRSSTENGAGNRRFGITAQKTNSENQGQCNAGSMSHGMRHQ